MGFWVTDESRQFGNRKRSDSMSASPKPPAVKLAIINSETEHQDSKGLTMKSADLKMGSPDHQDFHFERLNEEDERDLGFEDLAKQHYSLVMKDKDHPYAQLTFEKLIQNFDYMEDD